MIERPPQQPPRSSGRTSRVLPVPAFPCAALFFSMPRAQRRRQRERHQHRDHDGHRHGPAELVHVTPGVAGHEGDGNENDDQRDRGGHHRQRNLARRLNRRLHGRHVFLLDVAVDVFQHDDGVVDHDAHGQRQPQQRHRVQREVHGADQRERGDRSKSEWRCELISTVRQLRMNSHTIMEASRLPSTRCSSSDLTELRM